MKPPFNHNAVGATTAVLAVVVAVRTVLSGLIARFLGSDKPRVCGFICRFTVVFCTAVVIIAASAGESRDSVTEVVPAGKFASVVVVAA